MKKITTKTILNKKGRTPIKKKKYKIWNTATLIWKKAFWLGEYLNNFNKEKARKQEKN